MPIQLFTIHFAGGSCYSYLFMHSLFNSNIQVNPIELPGRGKRMQAPLLLNFEEALNDCYQQIKALRQANLPYIIYGHSMGALIGLMLTDKLEKEDIGPTKLVVSGNAGPNIGFNKNRYLMSDQDLKTELSQMGGSPEDVLSNKDLFDFFSPIIRADFELMEKVSHWPKTAIKCPVNVIMGDSEPHIEDIHTWSKYCVQKVNYNILSGGHFFINKQAKQIVEIIQN